MSEKLTENNKKKEIANLDKQLNREADKFATSLIKSGPLIVLGIVLLAAGRPIASFILSLLDNLGVSLSEDLTELLFNGVPIAGALLLIWGIGLLIMAVYRGSRAIKIKKELKESQSSQEEVSSED